MLFNRQWQHVNITHLKKYINRWYNFGEKKILISQNIGNFCPIEPVTNMTLIRTVLVVLFRKQYFSFLKQTSILLKLIFSV